MNVKPKFVYYDIRRKQSVCLIMYTHENDVDTQVLEVSMIDNGEPIELSADYTYSAAIVNRNTKALINDSISCELNDSGNVLIPIDNFHTLGAQDLLIELTITDSAGDQVLVTPFPLWIHVNASILDDAQVTPESHGTVPELLEEAAEALENAGDYENLDNKPQINGHELFGNKTGDDLGLQTTLWAGLNITFRDDAGVKRIDWVPKTSYGITAERLAGGSYTLKLDLDKVANSFHVPSTSINNYESNFMLVIDPNLYNYLIPVQEKGFIFRTCTKEPDPAFQKQTSHVFMRYITLDTKREFTRHIYKPNGGYEVDGGWIETNPTISTATVNQNGTITFTMSDGSTVTTTGESIIGPQGPAGADGDDYVLTPQDKTDIANIVLSELPTTQGVQYGNANS